MAGMLRFLLAAFARLPFAWVQGLGAALGWLSSHVPNEHRRVTVRNLELCYPDLPAHERGALARRSLVESGKTLTEAIALWLGPVQRSLRLVREVRGAEVLQAAVDAGRGVLLVSPHLGSWEVIGLYVGQRHPMICMYRPPRQHSFDTLVRESRQRTGTRVVPTDAQGIKALFHALKRGEVVGILPDQDPRDAGGAVFAPFFGVQANTMTLISRLAAKTGAAVIFTFAERLSAGRGFRLHLIPAAPAVADPDPVRAATALNAGVETCVRMAPAQYQWSYKRFRSRPQGERRFY
jgi:KDO2-lipid IV(A) lauroyltransferase